nr:hypothetical protein [Tanacetum cinerariifolium]
MKEYIMFEEEKARKCGKVFNWETAKYDKDNDNDKVDIEHSSRDLSVKPLPDVINTDVGAYAHGSNRLLETSHDTCYKKMQKTENLKHYKARKTAWKLGSEAVAATVGQWLLGVSGGSRGEWCGVVREAGKCGTRTDDIDAFDSDCDEIPLASAVFMKNLCAYDSDVLSEVPNHDSYQDNNMIDQSV